MTELSKRSYSKVKKPGKDQRKPIKLSAQVNPVVPPVSALVPVPGDPVHGPSSVVSRESARSRTKTAGQILSYDEIIEGEDAVALSDELDFRFMIPEEMDSIELV